MAHAVPPAQASLLVCMAPSSWMQPFSLAASIPILGVVSAIRPRARELAVVGESGLGSVVGELNGEAASSWEVKELAIGRWNSVTAAVCLEPPPIAREVEEWTDRGVCVLVILTRIRATSAVHAVGKSRCVSMSNRAPCQQGKQNQKLHGNKSWVIATVSY